MKSHYTKWAVIGLAVVVAAASIGVSYAKPSDKGHHSGDTVPTIYFNDPFSWVVSNDDGVFDTVPPYGLIDPGDDGGGTEYDYWGPSSSNDPSAPPPAMGQPCPRYDKDVASTDATLTDPHTIDVTVNNAYPCYYSSIFFAVENAGLVPITVQSIEVDENASTPDVLDDIVELTVTASGINLGQVIEPGTEEVGRLSVHVEQSAQQLATYTIRVKIVTVAPEPPVKKLTVIPPAVTTDPATVNTTLATLNGSLTDLGSASSVDVSFEWGITDAYGSTATVTASPLMSAPSAFSATLSGLSPGTTYHFRAKAVGDSTSYGLDMSFTTSSPSPGPLGTTDVRGMVGDGCCFIEPVSSVSEDGLCTLTIPVGTVGLTEDLECLPEITMVIMDDPPPPPEDAHVIGLVYDFGPDRAFFDPPIILTFTLPEGTSEEDLAIAYFVDGEWIELECVINTENMTITALVSHFSAFALIGTPPTVEEEPVVIKKPVVVKKEEEPAVVEEVEPAAVEEEVVEVPAGINWALIGWIIGGVVVVVGLIIFFLVRRRRRRKARLTRQ